MSWNFRQNFWNKKNQLVWENSELKLNDYYHTSCSPALVASLLNFSISWFCLSDHLPFVYFQTINMPPDWPHLFQWLKYQQQQQGGHGKMSYKPWLSLAYRWLVVLWFLSSSYQVPMPFVFHSPVALAVWQPKRKLDKNRNTLLFVQFLPHRSNSSLVIQIL